MREISMHSVDGFCCALVVRCNRSSAARAVRKVSEQCMVRIKRRCKHNVIILELQGACPLRSVLRPSPRRRTMPSSEPHLTISSGPACKRRGDRCRCFFHSPLEYVLRLFLLVLLLIKLVTEFVDLVVRLFLFPCLLLHFIISVLGRRRIIFEATEIRPHIDKEVR